MNLLRHALVVTCITLAAALAFSAVPGKENIITSDLLKIKQLRSVKISPDGTRAVYVVRSIEEKKVDKEEEKPQDSRISEAPEYEYKHQLWLVTLTGDPSPRQLTFHEAGASEPVWHPNGKQIAFVRKVEEKSQIFVLPLDGGEAWQLTKMKHGASTPRWSPDGNSILFASEIPHHELLGSGNEKKTPEWPEERPNRKSGDVANWNDKEAVKPKADPDGSIQEIREWLARNESDSDPRVFYRQELQGETELQPNLTFQHLFVVKVVPGAEPKRITNGFYSFQSGEWMPDGKEIVSATAMDSKQHPDRVLDSDLQIIRTDGSNVRRLLDLPDYSVFGALPSPDGKTIAFVASDLKDPGYALTTLGSVSYSGGNPILLTKELDREVNDYSWSRNSKFLYFISTADGGFPLNRVEAAGGKVQKLTESNSGLRNLDVAAKAIIFTLTEVANPYELYSANLDGSDKKRLTKHNAEWLESKKLSHPTAHKLTRQDGTVVDYWIMKPANFEAGKKYPLLVEMHGGPSAMWGPGEDTTWHEFQMFCGRGYGIVYANPRGSGGYGHKFVSGNFQNWGEGPGGDVLAAATEAAKEPWVDSDRQVLTGGSYAGYLTAWIVGHDHRFKAAVAQRGVYYLPTFMGEGLAWRLVPDHFGGYPWQPEIKTILDRESPLTYVNEIQTPLLIKHDDLDLRAGVIQSEMLYKSLKILNKPVEYVRYPKASHDLSRTGNPKQRIDRLLRILEFFERYIAAA
jgi:dipeptidyl aminopeptidase/acylaminoacyl peptidase